MEKIREVERQHKAQTQRKKRLASAQRLSLDREGDLDVVEILVLLKNRYHDLRSVVDSENNIRNSGLDR